MTPELPLPPSDQGPASAATPESAPWSRITFSPAADVLDEPYDAQVPGKEGAHVTLLLWARQVDVESSRTFFSNASRLQTATAVQNESQWKLTFQPRFQKLSLHWLRIVRAGHAFDHIRRDRMRLIQRESELERHVMSGSWTLVVVLDDVRPGDILEAAYSIDHQHPISHGWCELFYNVPMHHVVGRFHLTVTFNRDRTGMQCLASAEAPERSEREAALGRTRWSWEGAQLKPREAERNAPTSHLAYTWIQVSDVTWTKAALRLAEAWSQQGSVVDLAAFPEFARPAVVDAAAVTALVRLIQDGFRYLSVDLETGSWIPAPPGEVALQRRGDCKDLSWLAMSVLRSWGIRARAILVATALRDTVPFFLPMTSLFNHAILEVEVDGKARWFDLTMRSQGGDFGSQPVGWYGYGLPVDPAVTALEAQPGTRAPNLYAIREVLYVDVRKGQTTLAETKIRVEGVQADALRQARTVQGAEGFATERLKAAQQRYKSTAKRVGELAWRDDRERNVCEFAEVFEYPDAVYPGERPDRANFDVPPNRVVLAFWLPEDKPRVAPWYMPYPCELRHTITVVSKSLSKANLVRRRWSGPGYTFLLEEARLAGEWTKTGRLMVLAPEIKPEALADYRAKFADFNRACSVRFFLPWGSARAMKADGLGKLPPPERGMAAYVAPEDPKYFPEAKIGETPQLTVMQRVRSRQWGKHRLAGFLLIWLAIAIFSTLAKSCSAGR
jgi:hypothetical protein